MIVQVSGPHGSGKYAVIEAGLKALGMSIYLIRCETVHRGQVKNVIQHAAGHEPQVIVLEGFEWIEEAKRPGILQALEDTGIPAYVIESARS
jgi:Ni2+-binding GTPase involved in maturation of urease and hydrogenase